MISKLAGIILKKNTKTKVWWMKLGFALVLSNIFFFCLFSGKESEAAPMTQVEPHQVEVQLMATLLTPFAEGKRVLLVHRGSRSHVTGTLKSFQAESGAYVVSVHEDEANKLFQQQTWEILPYIKNLSIGHKGIPGVQHEIRY